MEPVICPKCGKEGQPADTFTDAEGQTFAYARMTLLLVRPFLDAEGRRHHHDPNRRSMNMRCEAGHKWVRHYYVSCWCGWPQFENKGSGFS